MIDLQRQQSHPNRVVFLFTFILLITSSSLLAQEGCRLDVRKLRPIITRFNPFFTDHQWEDFEKVESGRLDPDRLVIIRQKACRRHHILLALHLESRAIEKNDRFWITETLVMMKRVFFDDVDYSTFKKDFEVEYIRAFLANGTDQTFNFPIGSRTFICKIQTGDWGAKIKIEVIKLVLDQKIIHHGTDRKDDDGWIK